MMVGKLYQAGEQPKEMSLRDVANQVEGLLDDDGHYNEDPDRLSRGHPDYDESTDERAGGSKQTRQPRNRKGQFQRTTPEDEEAAAVAEIEGADEDADEEDVREAADATDDADTGDNTEEAAAEQSDEASADADDADTAPIQTLSDLAEALEVGEDDLKATLTHTFKAAGEEISVTLSELEKGYQREVDYQRNKTALSNETRERQQDADNRVREFNEANQVVAQAYQMAEHIIASELQSPAMQQLRIDDAQEFMLRERDIQQRLGALQQVRNEAAQNYKAFMGNELKRVRENELKLLRESIPDWGESHKAAAKGVMETLGFNGEEIKLVVDSRLIRGALELGELRAEVKTLREQAAKAKDTAKRVKREVPKTVKPGKRKEQTGKARIERNRVSALRKRLNQTGHVKDAAALIETMIE